MKRRRVVILRVLAFLLLGAIVNIAMAWGAGYSRQSRGFGIVEQLLSLDEIRPLWGQYVDKSSYEWQFGSHVRGCSDTELATTAKYFGTHLDIRPGMPLLGPDKGYATTVQIVEAGFPCRFLIHVDKCDAAKVLAMQQSPTILASNATDWLRVCTSAWPGFAINTVFYAGVLWLIFAGPFALRRRSRRRRGLCVKCGYDLRGSVDANACPECGTAGSSERVA